MGVHHHFKEAKGVRQVKRFESHCVRTSFNSMSVLRTIVEVVCNDLPLLQDHVLGEFVSKSRHLLS